MRKKHYLLKLTKVLITAFFSFSALFVAYSPVKAIGAGGISGYPANVDPRDSRTNSWFIYTLDDGATKEDAVIVTNNTNETVTVDVYAVDSIVNNMGGFALAERKALPQEIGKWVTLSTGQITLLPNSSKKVPFSLAIPKGTSPGEYAGGIVIEKHQKESANSSAGFKIVARVGIRIYAMVAGEIIRSLQISSFSAQKIDNPRQVKVNIAIKNQGNVSVDTTFKLLLTKKGIFGEKTFFAEKQFQVIKGRESKTYFLIPQPHLGSLILSGLVTYKDGEETKTIQSSTISFSFIPWLEILIVLQLIALSFMLFVLVRKRKKIAKSKVSEESAEANLSLPRKKDFSQPTIVFLIVLLSISLAASVKFYFDAFPLFHTNKIEITELNSSSGIAVASETKTPAIETVTITPVENNKLLTPAVEKTKISPTSTSTIYTPPLEKPTTTPILNNNIVKIKVLNGTQKKGAAANLAEILKKHDYKISSIGNAVEDYIQTEIIHLKEHLKQAEKLQATLLNLGFKPVLTESSSQTAQTELTLIIGEK